MVTFTGFSNLLPDPTNPIDDAGVPNSSGTPGPGFSAVSFTSVTDTQVSRTISGRGVQRDGGSQRWEFTISYNPMFRYQFDPIDTFLLARNPRRDPFYVILPQYSHPKDPNFTLATMVTASAYSPGVSSIMLSNPGGVFNGSLRPGDVFSISDTNDFNHQKVYKITRVESNAYYQAGTTQPSTSQLRVSFSPPLQRTTAVGSVVNLVNVKFRVITKSDAHEHQLNTDNLYSFSLALEEVQA